MKKITLLFTVFAVGATMIVSCKKKNTTPADPLIGKWKVTQTADDNNNNGTLDASELLTDSTNSYFTFNANGTGVAAYDGGTVTFSFDWVYLNNKTWLRSTIHGASLLLGPDTIVYNHIDNLTSTALTLKDTVGYVSWTIFTKQP